MKNGGLKKPPMNMDQSPGNTETQIRSRRILLVARILGMIISVIFLISVLGEINENSFTVGIVMVEWQGHE